MMDNVSKALSSIHNPPSTIHHPKSINPSSIIHHPSSTHRRNILDSFNAESSGITGREATLLPRCKMREAGDGERMEDGVGGREEGLSGGRREDMVDVNNEGDVCLDNERSRMMDDG